MRNTWPKTEGICLRGRVFYQHDLVMIRRLIRSNPTWGRTRLSEEVCKQLNWKQDNGRLKDRACRVALLRLEAEGYLQLPKRKTETGGRPPSVQMTALPIMPQIQMEICTDLEIHPVSSVADSRIWNFLVAKYHYLGLGTPVGRLLRYLIKSGEQHLGCISFSEAAWKVAARDQALASIGFSHSTIKNKLISNNRFLILPNVLVPNLASRILSRSTKNAVFDWEQRFGSTPLFVETFVDPSRFTGACYKATNWIPLGFTKGYAKRGGEHSPHRKPKVLFVRATAKRDQRKLMQFATANGMMNFETRATRKAAVTGPNRYAA